MCKLESKRPHFSPSITGHTVHTIAAGPANLVLLGPVLAIWDRFRQLKVVGGTIYGSQISLGDHFWVGLILM